MTEARSPAAFREPPTRDLPLPESWSVREGRDAYLAENAFTVESYDAKWTPASLLGVAFSVPNTARHRFGIMMHDLHHVATGYGTDPAGEGEISAWELRRGVRALGLYTGSIVVTGALVGLLVAPRRTLRAWRASGGPGPSLFHGPHAYDALLALSVAELRRILELEPGGLAETRRELHSLAPRA